VINAGARIGPSTIVNSAAVVEHDVMIGGFVHVAPNSTICGNAAVGDYTWVGAGAVVVQGIKIGENVMIGAGAVVIQDVPPDTVSVGVPARVIRRR
jgi:acetyltransferase EpsM